MFIAGFYTAKHLFGFRVGLSRSLQGSTLDVIEAYRHISVVKDQLADIRKAQGCKNSVCAFSA